MAIRTVITRGFGNGTFNGTIALVTLRGYKAGPAVVVAVLAQIRPLNLGAHGLLSGQGKIGRRGL